MSFLPANYFRRMWRGRRAEFGVVFVVILFFFALFGWAIFSGKFILGPDVWTYSYPLRGVAWAAIRRGELPLWTPTIFSGYPLLSMAQLAVGYPLTWFHLFLPAHWAEQIYVFAPFILAPLFTYAYARELKMSRRAALLTGLAFTYGGMFVSAIAHSGMLTNGLMWTPLLLIALERSLRRPFIPCLLGATAAYSMSVLNGHGQSFVYVGAVAFAYALFLTLIKTPVTRPLNATGAMDADESDSVVDESDSSTTATVPADETEMLHRRFGLKNSLRQRLRPLAVMTLAALLSTGVAAFQIFETLRAARRSVRNKLDYQSFSEGAFSPQQAFGSLFAPLHLSTDVTTYLSPIVLLLALFAVGFACKRWRNRSPQTSRIFFWFAVACIAWLLMLGDSTPLYRLVYHVPALNMFRMPSRHTFEWTFAASVLAGFGSEILLFNTKRDERSERNGWLRTSVVGGLLSASVIVAAMWFYAAIQPDRETPELPRFVMSLKEYLSWKTLFVLLIGAALWQAKSLVTARNLATGRNLIMLTVIIVCFVEPFMAFFFWWSPYAALGARFYTPSPMTRLLQQSPPEQNRIFSYVPLFSETAPFKPPRFDSHNLNALHGLHNVAGYEPLILERYSRALGNVGFDSLTARTGFTRDTTLLGDESHVLDLLNTSFLISYNGLRSSGGRQSFSDTYINKDGVNFISSDFGLSVETGATKRFGAKQFYGDVLLFVTSLSMSSEVAQDTTVARLRIVTHDKRIIERELRAGRDTAEWAHERPDVRPTIKHEFAPVFDSTFGDAEQSFKSYRYLARVALDERVNVKYVEVTNVSPKASLALYKISLFDSLSDGSTPLDWMPQTQDDRWEIVYEQDPVYLLRNRRALPRAWLVTQAKSVDGEEALQTIRGVSGQPFDPRRTALLETVPAELPPLSGNALPPDARVQITDYRANRLTLETSSNEPTLLVLSEIFYPGWRASIDGRDTKIFLTDFLLRSVYVPAGKHRIEMSYDAPTFRNGAMITFVTLFAILLMGLFYARHSSRKSKTGRTEESSDRAQAVAQ